MSRPGYALGMERPQSIVVQIAGVVSAAFAALTFKVKMPQKAKIIGIDLNVAARGGTHSTSTIDVKAGSTSLLATPFDVAAMTPATAVVKESTALSSAADSVAKDETISVILAESGGSSPVFTGASIQIDYIPLGG